MSSAIASLGSKVQSNISGSYVSVPEVNSITPPAPDREDIDVTSLDTSGGYREYIQGFRTAGEFTFKGNFIPGNAVQASLITAFSSENTYGWKILLPTAAVLCSFQGQVKSFKPSGMEPGQQLQFECTVKVTGAITWGS